MADGPSQDLKRGIPKWVELLVVIAIAGAPSLVAWGAMTTRVDNNAKAIDEVKGRVDKIESRADERERDVYKAIADMRIAVGSVQLDVARILAILKR